MSKKYGLSNMFNKASLQLLFAKLFYILRLNSASLDLLAKLKAERSSIKNVDYYRAKIRYRQKNFSEALQMVQEEMRLNRSNKSAQQLYRVILSKNKISKIISNDEWVCLYQKIKPYSMLSESRLHSLYKGAKQICLDKIPGNFVECGVAAGGSSSLLAWVINKYSTIPRLLFSFDTFSGMPPSTHHDTYRGLQAEKTGWGEGTCSAPVSSLCEIAQELGVKPIIRPVSGLFEITLPLNKSKIDTIALLHLDGDWYESTKTILENLYDQTCKGAYFQVDDYGFWEGCKKAVDEYFKSKNIPLQANKIDDTGIWFKK